MPLSRLEAELVSYRVRFAICRQSQTHGRHPFRFACFSIVWLNARGVRSLLAILREWVSESGVGLPDLTLSSLRGRRRFKFSIGF